MCDEENTITLDEENTITLFYHNQSTLTHPCGTRVEGAVLLVLAHNPSKTISTAALSILIFLFAMYGSCPSIERNWRSNFLSRHVPPPVLGEVLPDVNGAVLDMPTSAQVKCELQLFERATARFWHE
jgi:hypothetical protein